MTKQATAPEIWLARHAKPAAHGICYGQSDVAVSLSAADAASELRERFAAVHPAAPSELWTSPWSRCRDVADELGRIWGVPARVDPRLAELAFGAWEGRSFAELEPDEGFQFWMRNYETAAPPGGETVAHLMGRVAAWLNERAAGDSAGRVLAITHAGVARSARAIARGVSYSTVVSEPVLHLVPELLANSSRLTPHVDDPRAPRR